MRGMFSAVLCAGILIAHAGRLSAQSEPPVKVPPLSEIEPLDRTLKPALDDRYSILLKTFTTWTDSAEKWNSKYEGKPFKEGSEEARVGLEQKEQIFKALMTYDVDVGAFNRDVPALHLFSESPPARLERAVADAIAGAYRNSPPGVIEDIQNGFLAIDAGNWTVARISFKDALRRDPANVGIERLVALCDYSLTLTVPAKDLERGMNDFYLDYAPRHPELKLDVKTIPAAPAPVQKTESTIDSYIKGFLNLVRPPARKTGRTQVIAVRG